MRYCLLLLLLCAVLHSWSPGSTAWADGLTDTEFRMPGVMPSKGDLYLCTAIPMDSEREHHLVGFTPHGSMHTAHHMLMFACSVPGSTALVWNCGEMHHDGDSQQEFETGPVCAEGEQIMYAWAKDAPELTLPKGVGFKVGGNSPVQYLVLQVHYMHPLTEPDTSGLTLHSTEHSMPKEAHVILLATDGAVAAKSADDFETACAIEDDVELHPFAFRTHTHQHGKVVSGWLIRDNKWTLIGKKDPQKPQMFYPVDNTSIVIRQDDALAARCHMVNEENREIHIGPSGADEMCNFYLMYWTEPYADIEHHNCVSAGPPEYRWRSAGLENIPTDANKL